MADQYIANQKRIIKRRISKFWPVFFVGLFLASIFLWMGLWALLPTPQNWKTEDITIVDIQYRSKPRGFARYAPDGYELTDSNGNWYWVAGELTWPQKGQSYTVTYEQKPIYRYLKAVSHQGEVLKEIDSSIAAWERDSGPFLMMICGSIVVYVWLFVRLYKELHHPEIISCKKRIFDYEAKMQRRALDKRCK
jgi:hypothetical protein